MADPPVRSIERAVKILDCFLLAPGALGISELSRQTQLSKSTVHHLVTTLVETGLLAPDGPSRLYRLGPKVAQLGTAFGESTDLRDLVLPTLTELRDLTDETVTLHVKVGDQRVVMAQVVSTQGIRRVLEVGSSRPVHLGAVGMVLMADLSDLEVLQLLKQPRPRRLTPKTVTDPRQILELVRRARTDGYSTLGEQTEEGVGVIALPLHDHQGRVPAAIVISGPIQRWNPDSMAPYLERMVAIVEGVSRRLGRRFDGRAAR
jgi:DNA-binding IclR family transcriptional regulator